FPSPCLLMSHTPPTPTAPYTLSLHDALPIWCACSRGTSSSPGTPSLPAPAAAQTSPAARGRPCSPPSSAFRRCRETTPSSPATRSEEHTSELQSRFDLVCRLLLEKKHDFS